MNDFYDVLMEIYEQLDKWLDKEVNVTCRFGQYDRIDIQCKLNKHWTYEMDHDALRFHGGENCDIKIVSVYESKACVKDNQVIISVNNHTIVLSVE